MTENQFDMSGKIEFVKGEPGDIVKKMLDVMINEMTESSKDKKVMAMDATFIPRIIAGLTMAMVRGTLTSMGDVIQDPREVASILQQFSMDCHTAATHGIMAGMDSFTKEYIKK